MENKENYLHQVLNSLKDIGRAEPNPFLETRILARIQAGAEAEYTPVLGLKPRFARFAFFSLCLLFVCNLGFVTLNKAKEQTTGGNDAARQIEQEYFSYAEF